MSLRKKGYTMEEDLASINCQIEHWNKTQTLKLGSLLELDFLDVGDLFDLMKELNQYKIREHLKKVARKRVNIYLFKKKTCERSI